MNTSDIITRIKNSYIKQNRKRKQISDYILSNISACCFHPLKKLAEEAGTTEVTLLSYCRSLGYSSFTDFRDALREYAVYWNQPNERTWQIGTDGNEGMTERIVEAEMENLSVIIATDQENQIGKAVSMLLSAERIFIAAHGVSKVSADYCMRRLISIGKDAVMLDLSDPNMVSSHLSQNNPEKSLLIAIAISPHGKSTIRTVSLCREEGIPVIALTDTPGSPIAIDSDCTLTAPASILGVTNSIVSTVSLVEILSIRASISARSSTNGERYRKILEIFSRT